jgi:hypothetical protein
MTTDNHVRDDPDLPRVHQGDARGHLAAVTEPEWTVQYGYAPLVEYELRSGGTFRAYANEGMKAFGCPDVISDGEVIEANPPRKLVQTWRMTMTPELASEAFTRLTYDIEPVRGGVTKAHRHPRRDGCANVGRRTEGRERVERGRRRLERDSQRAKDAARDGPATPLPKWPGIKALRRRHLQRSRLRGVAPNDCRLASGSCP